MLTLSKLAWVVSDMSIQNEHHACNECDVYEEGNWVSSFEIKNGVYAIWCKISRFYAVCVCTHHS